MRPFSHNINPAPNNKTTQGLNMTKPITIPKINLSASETAHYLGIGKSDLDVARITGKLRGLTPPPFIRLGRSVRYRIKDLNDWLASQPAFTTNAQAEAK